MKDLDHPLFPDRDAFLENPGYDHDPVEMLLQMGFGEACEEEEDESLPGMFYDFLVERFSEAMTSGVLTLYRAIGLEDVDAYVGWLREGGSLGSHWSVFEKAASVDYNTGSLMGKPWMARAEVPSSSVDWLTTFQANFSMPWECEVAVDGPLVLTELRPIEGSGAPAFSGRLDIVSADDAHSFDADAPSCFGR